MAHEAPRRPDSEGKSDPGPAAPAGGPPDLGTLPVGDDARPKHVPFAKTDATGLQSPALLPATVSIPGEPALPAGHPLLGLPGYDVLGELGRGGMGVVYKARQPRLKRLVALKMILSGDRAGPEDLKRFQTEVEALARLQHSNIVQVYEVGEHEGKPYFSLEFCAGGSLADKLERNPLPPTDAAALVETLARAMHAAHQRGVIHRDLKPANILFTADKVPKITDFGLAKKTDEVSVTAHGRVLGSPSYMAPEQASGKGAKLGPAVDVYALGAILYECLTGRPPFRAATVWDTVMQVISREPVPPAQLQPSVPRDLDSICLMCLKKSPSKRYESAEALADDLHRFQLGEPTRARQIGAVERLVRWVRRRPLLAGLTCAVAALLILVAVVASIGYVQTRWALEREEIQRAEANRQRDEAELRRSEAEANRAEAHKQREAARVAEGLARDEAARTRRLLYIANLQVASQLWTSESGTAARSAISWRLTCLGQAGRTCATSAGATSGGCFRTAARFSAAMFAASSKSSSNRMATWSAWTAKAACAAGRLPAPRRLSPPRQRRGSWRWRQMARPPRSRQAGWCAWWIRRPAANGLPSRRRAGCPTSVTCSMARPC
jgi:tRNA A-37 threonylcarbamoyl transferase component Bud32